MDYRLFLRIGGGNLKGQHFSAPKGGKTVRPISDRVKEALFDILTPKLNRENIQVLDLFSGTGAIAFECISRGVQKVLCVEHDKRNIELIVKNATKLGVANQLNIIHGKLPDKLKRVRGNFSIVFMDPPFALDIAKELFPLIAKRNLLHPDGMIILQRDRRSEVIETRHFNIKRQHRVGDSILFFYGHPDSA